MKKFTFFYLFIVILLCPTYFQPQQIFAENIYYGRALSTDIYIYSSPQVYSDRSNKIFEIPVTYFVQLLADENELFYKVEYNGIYGYALKSELACVNAIPNTPYANKISFRVFTPSGAYLRSSPKDDGTNNLITTVPFLETNLAFFGNCEGEEAITYKGNTWYYCKYVKQEQEFFGYIYSPLCDMLTPIPQNTEQYEYVTPNFEVKQTSEQSEQYFNLNSPWHIVAIILICLPCIAIIYFLFKPTKIAMQNNHNKQKKNKEKKKISRLKHSDYYELDSDYFN